MVVTLGVSLWDLTSKICLGALLPIAAVIGPWCLKRPVTSFFFFALHHHFLCLHIHEDWMKFHKIVWKLCCFFFNVGKIFFDRLCKSHSPNKTSVDQLLLIWGGLYSQMGVGVCYSDTLVFLLWESTEIILCLWSDSVSATVRCVQLCGHDLMDM